MALQRLLVSWSNVDPRLLEVCTNATHAKFLDPKALSQMLLFVENEVSNWMPLPCLKFLSFNLPQCQTEFHEK